MHRVQRPETEGVIGIIPARHASSRFPGKPLAMVGGVPLVVRVFRRVATALPSSHIIVATDDERIQAVCKEEGIHAVMTSPACLTGTDRVGEVARTVAAQIILNIQGDEPLVQPGDILQIVQVKRSHPAHVVNAMCPISERKEVENLNVPKVVVNERDELLYMSRAAIPSTKRGDHAGIFRRQVCIYGFSPDQLQAFVAFGRRSRLEELEDIEILRFLELGIPVKMTELSGETYAVDVPEDIPKVEAILALNALD